MFPVKALTGNISFAPPWIAQVPSLVEITAAFNAYQSAYHASLSKDIFKIAVRESKRLILTNFLKQLAPYLELVVLGDVSKLISTGYALRHDAMHTQGNEPLSAPKAFRVLHGAYSGTLDIRVAKLLGAASYEVQIAQCDPCIESNWRHAILASNCLRISIVGLIPAQIYWLRVRGLGSNGMGAWSNELSIIVL